MTAFLSSFPNCAAALGRLWTRNLGVAFVVVTVAFLTTLVPFAVKFFEARYVAGSTLYYCFVTSIEEMFLAVLAISVSSLLNYLEGQDGRGLGRICAALTVISFLCTLIAIVAYFLVHFLGKQIFDPQHDTGSFAVFTVIFSVISITVSMVNILEARRLKDKWADFRHAPEVRR